MVNFDLVKQVTGHGPRVQIKQGNSVLIRFVLIVYSPPLDQQPIDQERAFSRVHTSCDRSDLSTLETLCLKRRCCSSFFLDETAALVYCSLSFWTQTT
jgi:hypothetical protein